MPFRLVVPLLVIALLLFTFTVQAKPGKHRFPVVNEQSASDPFEPATTRQPRDEEYTYPEKTTPVPASAPEPVVNAQTGSSYLASRHLGVSTRVGTLGFGLEVSTQLIQDRLNLRTGFNTFSYDYEAETEDDDDNGDDVGDLEYDGDLKLSSLPLLFDLYPFKGGFRATAGLIFNKNELNASARCNQDSCEFGDEEIDSDTLGVTTLNVDLGGTHGYLGLGWGNAVHSVGRWSFAFDIGVVFQDVDVSLQTSDSCQANAECQGEADRELAELQEDVEDFDMYPVLSFGLSYKIF